MTLLLLIANTSWAADNRIGVTVLPVTGPPEMSESMLSELEAGMPDGFVLVPMAEEDSRLHLSHPGCRKEPACLSGTMPEHSFWAVGASISGEKDGRVLDTHLYSNGAPKDRTSAYLAPERAGDQAVEELHSLLRGRDAPSQLYDRAVKGDGSAGRTLLMQYPDSPQARTLQQNGRQPVPQKSSRKDDSPEPGRQQQAGREKKEPGSRTPSREEILAEARRDRRDKAEGYEAGRDSFLELRNTGYKIRLFSATEPLDPPAGPWTKRSEAYQEGFREGFRESARRGLMVRRGAAAFGTVFILALFSG